MASKLTILACVVSLLTISCLADTDEQQNCHCKAAELSSNQPNCYIAQNYCAPGNEPVCAIGSDDSCSCRCESAVEKVTVALRDAEEHLVCKRFSVDSSAGTKYSLKVEISRNAVGSIEMQRLNLVIAKAFMKESKVHFNTAWIVETYDTIGPGEYLYEWKNENKASLTFTTPVGCRIRDQSISESAPFTAGQYVRYDGEKWNKPVSNMTGATIGVESRAAPCHAMHLVPKSPYSDRDGNRNWSPYFYSEEKSVGILEGFAPVLLAIGMFSGGVQQTSFIGGIFGEYVIAPYGVNTEFSVCIYTPPGEGTVGVKHGHC